jgi:hypothetical protein
MSTKDVATELGVASRIGLTREPKICQMARNTTTDANGRTQRRVLAPHGIRNFLPGRTVEPLAPELPELSTLVSSIRDIATSSGLSPEEWIYSTAPVKKYDRKLYVSEIARTAHSTVHRGHECFPRIHNRIYQ